MAFFDRLGKSVSEVSQKTIAKTRELADTSKLNALIGEQERTLNNLYFQIGKLYVSLHRNDFEEEFAGMLHGVADAEEKIRDYKRQIQTIRGVQLCEKCGTEVPNGAAFCSACGAPMPKPQPVIPTDTVKCGACGAMVKKGMRFCTVCGTPMETAPAEIPAAIPEAVPVEVPAAVPEAPAVIPAAQQNETSDMQMTETAMEETTLLRTANEKMYYTEAPAAAPAARFCTNCGAKMEGDLAFCTECGTKL